MYMGYNYNDVKNELIEKGLADDNLVALGEQPISPAENLGSLILGVKKHLPGSSSHAITKQGDKIVIYPFSTKGILYNEALTLEKSDIVKVSVYNFMVFEVRFKTTIKHFKKLWLPITLGKDDMKQILSLLGLSKKKDK